MSSMVPHTTPALASALPFLSIPSLLTTLLTAVALAVIFFWYFLIFWMFTWPLDIVEMPVTWDTEVSISSASS